MSHNDEHAASDILHLLKKNAFNLNKGKKNIIKRKKESAHTEQHYDQIDCFKSVRAYRFRRVIINNRYAFLFAVFFSLGSRYF